MWSEPEASYKANIKFAENVKAMTGGRVQIETFSSGSLMPYTEYFDAIRAGVVDLVEAGGTYWTGKDATLAAVDSSSIFIDDYLKALVWMWEYGGIDLARKAYAVHGLYYIGNHCYGFAGESMVFKTPAKTEADIKGIKMRAPEDAAETWKALGANTLTIPGAEVYTALNTGLVDAADWSSVGANFKLKFHEVAKYYTRPGDYHVGGMGELTMKQDKWNALPDDIKNILLVAAKGQALNGWTMTSLDDFTAIEGLTKAGAQMLTWDPALTKKVKQLYQDSLKTRVIKTPGGDEIYNSIQAFKKLSTPP
jgi:TRAP-type mannitol/chloroaromatic compound transport system substrate-binding protein